MELPRIAPMPSYEDVGVAADWLCAAFGFTEAGRFEYAGRVTHLNLAMGASIVMAGWPGPDYRNPKNHREAYDVARSWLDSPFVIDGVYVRVDDIETHFDRARAAGATMLSQIETNGPLASGSTEPRTSKGTAGCSPSRSRRTKARAEDGAR